MSEPSAFDELAAGAGIEPYYFDMWGARHVLSIDTRRAFLHAMGMSAATEEQIARSLAALTTKPWRRALESVTFLREGHNEWATSVVFEAGPASPATWQVTAEDGTQYEGNISPGDLPLAEAKTVDGQRLERRLLVLPGSLPLGYHRLEVMGDALPHGSGAATLIVAPQQAHLPNSTASRRASIGRLWSHGLTTRAAQEDSGERDRQLSSDGRDRVLDMPLGSDRRRLGVWDGWKVEVFRGAGVLRGEGPLVRG